MAIATVLSATSAAFYGVSRLELLPGAIREATLALLKEWAELKP
jgi:hypothetical protein